MSVRSRHGGLTYALAVSLRLVAQRFSFVFFLVLSLGLLVIGHARPVAVEHARAKMVDGVAPVLDGVTRPMNLVRGYLHEAGEYFSLRAENEKLRAQMADLKHWQNTAVTLENENKELRDLLHYKTEPSLAYISARVIADADGPFVRSLVVTAGEVDGVRLGMAAMTGEGLIGRVIEVGDWSSRVLLITDMSSRLPVTVTGGGDHAILAGDNTVHPKLLFLPQDNSAKEGDRVITSGHGGVFPPNLPVGVVGKGEHGVLEVIPLAAIGRISHVRLVDFNLTGGAFNPMAARIATQRPAP
jgi:rod shape-determining protein MreC